MTQKITNWLTGETILEYEGDLKTALVEAIQRGVLFTYADLRSADLGSANLRSANLGYADLRSADLRSADLRYANLGSADLGSADLGSQIVIQGPTRSDGHFFLLTNLTNEGWRIKAGCRNFTVVDAREHWNRTRGTTPLGMETVAILDCLEAMAAARGLSLTETTQPAAEVATTEVAMQPAAEQSN
jgi:hypothetical protein